MNSASITLGSTGPQMQTRLGTSFYNRGMHTVGSALVNPAALMAGLARNLPQNVAVFEDTPVLNFDREGTGFRVETAQGTAHADRLILAAGVFLRQFGIAKITSFPWRPTPA